MKAESSRIMLEEMRHSFDTVYSSVRKYTDKTFAEFGAELAFLLFYLSSDEISKIKGLFSHLECGWYLFAVIAAAAFVTAAILFIIALGIGKWRIPPDERRLLECSQYKHLANIDLMDELITEYNSNINHCIKKISTIKKLSDGGLYFLVLGAACLLIIKFFGV